MSGAKKLIRNPYPDVRVSEEERQHLIDLVSGFIEDHFHKYEEFIVVDKSQVDERRWEHVKSKDNLQVYTERFQKNSRRKSKSGDDDSSATEKDIAVMLSVGTLVGELDDLMFGLVCPTQESMSIRTSFFRQTQENVIDNFTSCVIDPGGKAMRLLFIPVAARAMLTTTDFAYCGQMKKLSRLLQQQLSNFKSDREALQQKKECVVCGKISSKKIRGFGPSTCKLCSGRVCSSCKIRKRVSFISQGNLLIQRKMAFCPPCISLATNSSAQDAARDQATGFKTYDGSSASPHSNESATELYD
ncbi:hypothetical protein PF001_g11177 [Phytophthora fragariae]|uniref:FYVE-type domain-containing protein n=1 Tax=Phytophthora fragariae TaxID=53985 RepID=A0A6A4DH75_9STRA|nr:hypothetical protein PF001_g11177 [Phytophthora fragariae]